MHLFHGIEGKDLGACVYWPVEAMGEISNLRFVADLEINAPERAFTDELSRWILDLQSRRGTSITVVALANKIARTIWVLLARGQEYKPCV
ncbi:hypothetical protein PQQ96_11850 [Paraburkholderia sediminicola]